MARYSVCIMARLPVISRLGRWMITELRFQSEGMDEVENQIESKVGIVHMCSIYRDM